MVDQPIEPICEPFFEIPAEVPIDHRQQIMPRLLYAYYNHESMNIGFDEKTALQVVTFARSGLDK